MLEDICQVHPESDFSLYKYTLFRKMYTETN